MTDFWVQGRFVVTGGAGFLGRAVTRGLDERGAKNVFVPRSKDYDLRVEKDAKRMYADFEPTHVIHLAATAGGIGANRREPGRFFYDNIIMGVHLIEHARLAELEKFVLVGTVCAYPKFAEIPFREENIWEGYPEETNAPYGIAKKSLMVMARAYRAQYDLNAITLLPANLYGPYDDFSYEDSHVIPALIRKFVEAKSYGVGSVDIWGTGEATREFLYVDDCAEGILLATEKYSSAEPVNMGCSREISIANLVGMIMNEVGYKGKLTFDPSKPDGQPRRMLDNSRAKNAFGYEAKVLLEEGIRRTVKWYIEEGAKIWSGK
ncbi:MAG: GDP-L-fucose synthase [Planctomycetota bacterium]|nr:MAG: GDP-L-fucose synthase [Planctomycetota bacterium]